jgi:hypothetical protein
MRHPGPRFVMVPSVTPMLCAVVLRCLACPAWARRHAWFGGVPCGMMRVSD